MIKESYTKIPNDLLSALAAYKFNGRQRAIIDVICRYTFGFNRSYYKFPVALFEAFTGIKRNNISAELARLTTCKVINIIGNPTKTETRLYTINMNFTQWTIEKREVSINIEDDITSIENDTTSIENDSIKNDTNLVSKTILNYSRNQYQTSIENDTHIRKSFNNNSNNKNIVDTDKPVPTTQKFLDDSFEMKIVNTIIESCLEIYPNSKVPSTYKDKYKWAIDIERMKRLDNRTEEEIRQALNFAINDSFWKSNIRSAKKFREKFETLYIQSKQNRIESKSINKGQQLQEDFSKIMEDFLNESTGICEHSSND
ncbi:hypothetical protein GCM10023142_10970 [Anaerocolumna aminovalerica]|uniref:Phage replication protein O, N-terminal domain-containing protein n=1 Tax=Anaerocolumna aminovalerica TaxID=1527 RepID=A0A1I5IYL6_9FIRM|nr:replication protein [Anaerocolumna aminovalerica]SFO65509.1 phage replication protein O, N-terminal domain-containing protein [Anaerocolumna aminovalerica]